MGSPERRRPPYPEEIQLAFWRERIEYIIFEVERLFATETTVEAWASSTHLVPLILQGLLSQYGEQYLFDVEDPNFVPYEALSFSTSFNDQMRIDAEMINYQKSVKTFTCRVKDRSNPHKVQVSVLCFPNYRKEQDLESLFRELSLTLFLGGGSAQHFAFDTAEKREQSFKIFVEFYLTMLRVLYNFIRDKEEALSNS